MRTRTERRVAARYRWDRLKVSFWFTSAIMAVAAVLLAWFMYWVDGRIPNELLQDSHFVLSGTVGEMRGALLSWAGTVLATAGVVFTLLTLPLSTVAAQYGSRLLRLFLGDRTAQFVLGMFVATFVYCVAAALSIPPASVEPQAPQLTTTVGLYLMLATFATLILLVQHVSTMLQAPNIAAAAGADLLEVVRAEIDARWYAQCWQRGRVEKRARRRRYPRNPGGARGLSGTCHRHRLHPVHRSGGHISIGPRKKLGHSLAAPARALCPGGRGGCPGLACRPGR